MKRRKFLKYSLLTSASTATMDLNSLANSLINAPDAYKLMPALFVGHGAPTYVLGENKYNLAWKKIGESIPKPKAIVCISAHWLTQGKTAVTAMPNPKTIHDFGGFPDEMYQFQYPAPGKPDLAKEISNTIINPSVELNHQWGFDHGTWTVLYHMFPNHDIPVLQLSIDYSKGAQYHFDLAKKLMFLRKKGVFVISSGNIVHNLRQIIFKESAQYDWALEFDETSKNLIEKGDFKSLINYQNLGKSANLSIPTPDHYFPLMYALGLKTEKDQITFPVDGVTYGSTSMRSVLIA